MYNGSQDVKRKGKKRRLYVEAKETLYKVSGRVVPKGEFHGEVGDRDRV